MVLQTSTKQNSDFPYLPPSNVDGASNKYVIAITLVYDRMSGQVLHTQVILNIYSNNF